MSELYQEIYQSLRQGKELVIATIISDRGSTPRTSGAKMIVYRDSQISGTIGGGAVEADAMQIALNLFDTQGAIITSYDLNQTAKGDQMDLICGGRMQVLLEHVPVSYDNIEVYGIVCGEIGMSRPFFFVGKVKKDGARRQVERAVQTAQKTWIGSFQTTHALQLMLETGSIRCNTTSLVEMEDQSYIVESIMPPDTVYIVGGGHVAKEIAALTKHAGFRTLIFDDRAEFANPRRFSGADEVHVCPDFAGLFEKVEMGAGSYIIIVTRGHRFDKEALAQALQTKAGYIGLIGSRRKKEYIYQTLINEGFTQSALDQVYCPIGLSIDAETPAEIGVSVVAQLIHHRAGRKTHG